MYADRIVTVTDGQVRDGDPAEVMVSSPVVPPVVELGRLAGWDPLALSVRDARRRAGELRARLGDRPAVQAPPSELTLTGTITGEQRGGGDKATVVEVDALSVRYGTVVALREVALRVEHGEVLAVMGRNGAGKSTLLAHLAGLRAPTEGRVRVLDAEPHRLTARDLVRKVALVPSDPGLLLYHESVAEECSAADRDAGLEPGTTAALLSDLVGGIDPSDHPRDLSEGQRLSVALAVVMAPGPPVLLLDEPTRGLDYEAKQRLVTIVRRLASDGHTVVMASHDVELVAELAHRVVVLADGDVVADGPAREVVCQSPIFAPQVAKILAPAQFLTVSEVAEALAS